jgi:hypothetical protein
MWCGIHLLTNRDKLPVKSGAFDIEVPADLIDLGPLALKCGRKLRWT